MPQILIPAIAAGLTPIVGSAVASFAAPLLIGLATSAIGLLFAEKPPDPEGGRIPFQQDTPPIIWAAGINRLSGAVALLQQHHDKLMVVHALCGHRINSFERYFLDDNQVTLAGDTVQTLLDGAYGDNRVHLYRRVGLATETSYVGDEGALTLLGDTVWTMAHRGDNTASFFMTCAAPGADDFQKRFPNGKPQPSTVMECALLYDPRDVAQDPDDPMTWVYSRNLALIVLWLSCFNEYTAEYTYADAVLPVVEHWKNQADICDEDVTLNLGGTEKRYHGSIWGSTADAPASKLQQALAACDGELIKRGDGALMLFVGKFQWGGAIINDDMIVGYHRQHGIPDEQAINRLNIVFTSPEHLYGRIECDPFDESHFDIARSHLRSKTLDATVAQSFTHARRLGKREVFRQNQRYRGTFDLKLSAINPLYERWSKIVSTRFPELDGKYIENLKPGISLMNGGLRIEWQGAGNGTDIDIWTPATDEGMLPWVPERPTDISLKVPQNVNVEPELFNTGTAEGVRLVVSFDTPENEFNYRIRWQVKDTDPATGGDQPGPWNSENHYESPIEDAGRSYLTTGAVQAETVLVVEIAILRQQGTLGAWSLPKEVNTGFVLDDLGAGDGDALGAGDGDILGAGFVAA